MCRRTDTGKKDDAALLPVTTQWTQLDLLHLRARRSFYPDVAGRSGVVCEEAQPLEVSLRGSRVPLGPVASLSETHPVGGTGSWGRRRSHGPVCRGVRGRDSSTACWYPETVSPPRLHQRTHTVLVSYVSHDSPRPRRGTRTPRTSRPFGRTLSVPVVSLPRTSGQSGGHGRTGRRRSEGVGRLTSLGRSGWFLVGAKGSDWVRLSPVGVDGSTSVSDLWKADDVRVRGYPVRSQGVG